MEQLPSSSMVPPGVDPLLKDLSEKKATFRRNIESLVAELEEARRRVASQEQFFAIEARKRQEAETKVKVMEKEMEVLNKSIDEKDEKLHASESAAQMLVEELGDMRLQLSATRAIAHATAQSAVLQCSILLKELEDKNRYLEENEACIDRLEELLYHFHNVSCARECSESHLKDEISQTEKTIMQALYEARADRDNDLWRVLDADFVEKHLDITKQMKIQDCEIAKLKDVVDMAANCKVKTREIESQLEKHYKKNQELKKKVLKMDFLLQELRAQARKLRRREDMKNKTIEEMRNQLEALQHPTHICKNQNFWGSGFRIIIPMSMIVFVLLSKR